MRKKRQRNGKWTAAAVAVLLLTAFATGCADEAPEVAEKDLFEDASSQSAHADDISMETDHAEPVDVDNTAGLEETGTVYSQTILVYMVGSDLESEYGSASADLKEMQAAMPDTENNHILVYTGGASEWQLSGLSAEEDTVLELTEDGFQKVSTMDAQNMGEAETLHAFLSYGLEKYESDQYGLILWNHGAGPVFGFGVDENYNDLLSLTEMQAALEAATETKKLEWIGFDACLMSSLEIADVLAPYANYLISSQETEPGWGWNYAFLSQLSEPDMDGARLGKAIIDTYMEYGDAVFAEYPNLYSDLTLSCVDLTKYQAVEDALNGFFGNMGAALTTETFPTAVRDRDKVKDFGSYSADFNYSLVDAVHLLELLAANSGESAEAALAALQDMTVYVRGNVAHAGGISVCYPYQTDAEYEEYCLALQEHIGFVENYTKYLQSFHAIEDGETIVQEWDVAGAETAVEPITAEVAPATESSSEAESEMEPETIETESETEAAESASETAVEPAPEIQTGSSMDGGSDISLALTPEQQQNFGTAAYYILCKAEAGGYLDSTEDARAEDMYIFVHGGKNVTMDENGVLHAYYSDKVVYMKDAETGERPSIPMVLIDNNSSVEEKRYLTSVVLTKTDGDFDVQAVNLQVVVNDMYPNGIIRHAVPISDAEEEVTRASKQLLNLDDFNYMSVTGRCSYLTRDENGKILPFFEWEQSGMLMGFEQDLQTGYELEVCPIENPENYVCMFLVKDAQGNTSVSELIPLG